MDDKAVDVPVPCEMVGESDISIAKKEKVHDTPEVPMVDGVVTVSAGADDFKAEVSVEEYIFEENTDENAEVNESANPIT